jgi:cytochrome c oxidase subunit 1
MAAATIVFLVNVLVSRKRGALAGADPWGAAGLEWSVSSPPPVYNFADLPTVRGRYALWEGFDRTAVVTGLSTKKREVLCTSVLDAQPEHRYELCGDSMLPLATGLITGAFFVALVFTPWAVPMAAAAWAVVMTVWFWVGTEQPQELHHPHEYHEPRPPDVPLLALGSQPEPQVQP